MITDGQELRVTQERIAYFTRLLGQLRVSALPDEFPAVAGGYRAEIERMQAAALDYLARHATLAPPLWSPPTSH